MITNYQPLQWKPIPGFPAYEINELGTIRSVKRKSCQKMNGKRHMAYLNTRVNNWGYRQVKLSKGGKVTSCCIHRLVALTFLSKPPHRNEVNHLNGDKLDNRPENLEWTDHAGNIAHAYRSGLIAHKGKPVYDRCNKKMYRNAREAAEALGIPYNTVRNYLSGNIRKNPTCLSYHRKR